MGQWQKIFEKVLIKTLVQVNKKKCWYGFEILLFFKKGFNLITLKCHGVTWCKYNSNHKLPLITKQLHNVFWGSMHDILQSE